MRSATPSHTLCLTATVVLTLFAITGGATAQPISDTFTLDNQQRVAARSLDGLTTEQGAAIWRVSEGASAVFTSEGAIGCAKHSAVQAQIAVAAPTQPTTVQIQAVLKSSDWVAVAFHSTDKTPDFFDKTRDAQLWLMLRPSGHWQLWQQGISKSLRDGLIASFDSLKPHTLLLTYDPTANTVTARVDNQTVVGALPLGQFKPSIHAAGFRINALKDVEATDARVDNFKLETTAP